MYSGATLDAYRTVLKRVSNCLKSQYKRFKAGSSALANTFLSKLHLY